MKSCEPKCKLFCDIRQWLSSAAGKISVILLIISIALIIIGASDWGNLNEHDAEVINNLLFGLATNLLGIIVTVSFVQYFLDRQSEKDARDAELAKILRSDKVMQILIQQYTACFNRLTSPIEKAAKKISDSELHLDFCFSDMKDLYKSSLFLRDKMYQPAITSFYEIELELRNYCMSIVREIDYKYFPGVGSTLLLFVEISLSHDVRGSVLGNQTMKGGEVLLTDTVSSYIGDITHDWVEEINNSEHKGNIMTPYVTLYNMLKAEGQEIKEYCRLIEGIKGTI